MNCANHCYKNEIAMHESFALLVCTKEDFKAFKVADPSEATMPAKVESRPPHPSTYAISSLPFPLPLESKDSVDTLYGESYPPFYLSVEISIASSNAMGVFLAASSMVKEQHPEAHNLSPSSEHSALKLFSLDSDLQDSHFSNT